MITIRPYKELGNANYGWLNAHYHFSFARYVDRNYMGFGPLRVINDDIVSAHNGFDTHPHDNMEIITYVRKGAITHKDSLGNEGKTKAGDVQVMSAGTGIFHSEYNHEDEDTLLYQIWITPKERDIQPRWDTKEFPKEPVTDKLTLLATGHKEHADQDALFINQDAAIYAGTIPANQNITHKLDSSAYILVSRGQITINGQKAQQGDGIQITDIENLDITAIEDSELLVIEVNHETEN